MRFYTGVKLAEGNNRCKLFKLFDCKTMAVVSFSEIPVLWWRKIEYKRQRERVIHILHGFFATMDQKERISMRLTMMHPSQLWWITPRPRKSLVSISWTLKVFDCFCCLCVETVFKFTVYQMAKARTALALALTLLSFKVHDFIPVSICFLFPHWPEKGNN